MKTHYEHDKRYTCPSCGCEFDDDRELALHTREAHGYRHDENKYDGYYEGYYEDDL